MEQLIIQSISRERRFALIENGTIEMIHIEKPGKQSLVGNIYLGIVEKVIPGMDAAFVNFGEDVSGFLSKDKLPSYISLEDSNKSHRSISTFLHQGEKILVQVEKDAAGTKGARLTGIIELQGEALVYMPNGKYVAISKKEKNQLTRNRWKEFAHRVKTPDEGFIFRTEGLVKSEDEMIIELNHHRKKYQEMVSLAKGMKKPGAILERDLFFEEAIAAISKLKSGIIVVDNLELKKKIESNAPQLEMEIQVYKGKENIFSFYKVEPEIEKLLKRIVWLDKGAYLVVDQVEALTIIDVNTGKFSGKMNLQDTVLKTNIRAALEAARQIRLRDLAGIILIDFIDMKDEEDRETILSTLKKELIRDERRTRIVGFTELGILQLTRKKTKSSLSEMLTENCGTCGGSGRVASPETMAYRLERELWEYRGTEHEGILVAATKEVIGFFAGEESIHKNRLEQAIGLKILFKENQSDIPFYSILQLGSLTELKIK